MKIFLDPEFTRRVTEPAGLALSPFAFNALGGGFDDKTAFLREDMFAKLKQEPLYGPAVDAAEADAVMMPLTLMKAREVDPSIERHYRAIAAQAGRPLIVECFGDTTDDIEGENLIVLRTSKYRSTLRPNEIICPPVIEDIGEKYAIDPVQPAPRPSVGFVGLAQKRDGFVAGIFPYSRHDYLNTLLAPFSERRALDRSGVYFRQQAIRALETSTAVDTDIVVRKFWGRGKRARNQIGGDQIRQDFIENMRRNLYTLSIRGRGNFSLRFFETLSAGRIPLQIDTDSPLPLEGEIDYRDFCAIVDWRNIAQAGTYLAGFHDAAGAERLIDIQRTSRRVFEEKLRFDVFARNLFADLLPKLVSSAG